MAYYPEAANRAAMSPQVHDQLARLEAENARLETTLSEWKGSHGVVEKHLEEIAAENARLRAALQDGCDLGLSPDECRAALAHSADA